MSSVWKTDDGTLGLVFTNISTKSQPAAYTLHLEEYGFPKGKRYIVSEITENGTVKVAECESTDIPVRELLPGRSVLLLQVNTH